RRGRRPDRVEGQGALAVGGGPRARRARRVARAAGVGPDRLGGTGRVVRPDDGVGARIRAVRGGGPQGRSGALVLGALLAGHRKAGELSRMLVTGKEVLLVAFFLSIGLTGTPTWEALGVAALLALLIPVKSAAFFGLLWMMRLRYRTSALAGLALGNYSEFALIVAAVVAASGVVAPDWVVVLALAVAMSFLLSAVLNRLTPRIEEWVNRALPAQDPDRITPDDRPIDLGDVDT